MAEIPRRRNAEHDAAAKAQPIDDLAAEAERARTPLTPLRALIGVWLTVAAVVALVLLALALILYFVYGE
jgi:hypothetical protein